MRNKRTLAAFAILFLAATAFAQTPVWTLERVGGDSLSGQIGALSAGAVKLIVRGSTLEVAAKDIGSLTQAPAPRPLAPGPDALILADGSVLNGRYSRMEKGALYFDSISLGTVKVPLDQASELSLGGARAPAQGADPLDSAIALKGGSLVIGRLKADAAPELLVSAAGYESKLNALAIAAARFPAKAPADSSGRVSLSFANGESISGTSPELAKGTVFLTIPGGARLGIPLASVAEIAYGAAGLASLKSVLVWSAFADQSEEGEHANVLAILEEGLEGWNLRTDFTEYPGADFRGMLGKTRTLVIPETENWSSADPAALADALERPLLDFLAKGGTIVILAPQEDAPAFWRDIGLIDLEGGDFKDGTLEFTGAGKAALGAGLGSGFETINGTSFYVEGPSLPLEVWAQNEEGIVAAARRVGRGKVIVLGMDYYDPSEDTGRVLLNAVQAK